jgi:hypothetical protein
VVCVHTNHVTTHYMIYHLIDLYFRYSDGSKKLPDDGRLLPKHVGASILNKDVVKISVYCWLFLLRIILGVVTAGSVS